jgi:hypothetical protein
MFLDRMKHIASILSILATIPHVLCNDCAAYPHIIAQISATNFSSDINYSLNFGIALRNQFPQLVDSCPTVGFISGILTLCLMDGTNLETTHQFINQWFAKVGFRGIYDEDTMRDSLVSVMQLGRSVALVKGGFGGTNQTTAKKCSAISYRYKSSTSGAIFA